MPMLVVNSDPERLWGKPLEPTREELSKMYFTIEAIEDGEISFTMYGTGLFCSTDNGETWNKATSPFSVSAGDKVLCKSTSLATGTTNKFDSTGKWNVYGNILSLKYGDDFEDKDTELNIEALFRNSTTLVSAKNLILPNSSCKYSSSNYGYSLFYGCTSLEEAPELPATTLEKGCYAWMFSGCSSLKKAPELPATTLATNCYKQMFQNCTSLTTGPELPATTLEEGCYYYMFNGCTSLNYIKMLATDISADSCLEYWTSGVSPTGTFVKAAGVEITTGTSGIPEGWTVEEV